MIEFSYPRFLLVHLCVGRKAKTEGLKCVDKYNGAALFTISWR